jgi:aerobic-type carbon monoxide dehydrogenase small subunit (CoxS/CutS family)
MTNSAPKTIELTINGKVYKREVEPRVHLADFLRHEIGLTGTHLGCEHGVCGACSVLVNSQVVRGCLMLAVQADGCEVMTVEGLAADGKLNPLQEAFREFHALQCGFCTPGMLMTLTEILRDHPKPTEELLREELSGNLCRCTGYSSIVKAALKAAPLLAAPQEGSQ